MSKYIIILLMLLFQFSSGFAESQIDSLRKNIENYIKSKKADVGVAIYGLKNGDTLTVGNSRHYPMQSVYKFHLALAILTQVDSGMLSLNQKILIRKRDFRKETWSPLREKYPNGNIELTLGEIIQYTISQSDNNGCDILFKLIGGRKKVNDFIHNLGIKEISIKATENEMHQIPKAQFTNWSTPFATVQLLVKFYQGQILSKNSFDFLWESMVNSLNASDRIKGQLPKGTIVAHKTGTSGKNDDSISAALNDIGIVSLPNGKHFAICVFVSHSTESDETNAKIIAGITKMAWDYFVILKQ